MWFGDKLTSVGEWENLKFEGEMRSGEVGVAIFGLTVDANEWGWIGVWFTLRADACEWGWTDLSLVEREEWR